MIGASQHQRAQGGDHQQQIHFFLVAVVAFEISVHQRRRCQRDDENQRHVKRGEVIHDQQGRHKLRIGQRHQYRRQQRQIQPDNADRCVPPVMPFYRDGQHHHDGRRRSKQDRQQRNPLFSREHHGAITLAAACGG
jgi:hypothetical protein